MNYGEILMDIIMLIHQIYSSDDVVLKLTLGVLFGFCLGLTGVGGGVMLIPMLQIFCGMTPVLAVGTASLISSLVKINASIIHVRAKNVSWRHVMLLFVGAIPTTLLITQIVIYYSEHPKYELLTHNVIFTLVTLVMVGSLFSVCVKFIKKLGDERNNVQLSTLAYVGKRRAILSGMFCGSVLGSTGVGGGVLLLPILNSVLNVDIKKAVGSSVILALFLSTIAAVGYAKGGQADLITAIWFVLGASIGVFFASSFLSKISEKLVYMITIFVIIISLFLYLGF